MPDILLFSRIHHFADAPEVNTNNVRGTFLTVKHFLRSVKAAQDARGGELDNVAIVITGSETGKFGQEGHAESVFYTRRSQVADGDKEFFLTGP